MPKKYQKKSKVIKSYKSKKLKNKMKSGKNTKTVQKKIKFNNAKIPQLSLNTEPRSGKEVRLKIFYQSLEAPYNFRKKLATEFDKSSSKPFQHQSPASSPRKYYRLTQEVFDNIKHLEPDIIVIGEFTPSDDHQLDMGEYTLIDFVHQEKGVRKTRGMTVYARENSKNWDRIRVCNQPKFRTHKDIYRDPNHKKDRHKKGRKKRVKKLKEGANVIGQFIEVMVANRYIVLSHTIGCGASARCNARKFLNGSGKGVHMGGDQNFNLNGKQHHQEVPLQDANGTNYIMKANSDASALVDKKNVEPWYREIQLTLNYKGRTATAEASHDGIITYEQARTKISIEGALWAIAKEEELNLMSDHKGILINVACESFYDGYDTDTEALSDDEEYEQMDLDKK